MTIASYRRCRTECCLCVELSGIGLIGIGVDSQYELSCLKEFCNEFGIELELHLSVLELNCKNGIDPGSGAMWWFTGNF